jgi:hypothetical protein
MSLDGERIGEIIVLILMCQDNHGMNQKKLAKEHLIKQTGRRRVEVEVKREPAQQPRMPAAFRS